jgi:hypothetical protein
MRYKLGKNVNFLIFFRWEGSAVNGTGKRGSSERNRYASTVLVTPTSPNVTAHRATNFSAFSLAYVCIIRCIRLLTKISGPL